MGRRCVISVITKWRDQFVFRGDFLGLDSLKNVIVLLLTEHPTSGDSSNFG